jgi:multiple sugar transport system permease protein
VISLRLRRGDVTEEPTGGLLAYTDWARRDIKWLFGSTQALLLVLLVLIGLGPVVWLAKGAVTPTIDTLRNPLALFPHGVAWSNLSDAWTKVNVGRYFWNTVVLALGSWLCQIVVATTGAFVLSVLRPAWGRFVYALLLGTLFVPVVVLIVLMKLFFDNLPKELFEAARIDGARPSRLFVSIVLPLSKPIIGVVSIFAIVAEWKNFLWPFLVLTNSPDRQPLSVRLPAIQAQTQLGVLLASMLIAALVPILGFLIFQRSFLRGSGFGGALKG